MKNSKPKNLTFKLTDTEDGQLSKDIERLVRKKRIII